MDQKHRDWLKWHITHRNHRLCNPMSVEKIDEIGQALGLSRQTEILDIACGMGEVLMRWHEQWSITGQGVDISPWCIQGARRKQAERCPNAPLEWIEANAAEWLPETNGKTWDGVMCLGASFIWKDYRDALDHLAPFVKQDGWLVFGEPYWMVENPSKETLNSFGCPKETFDTDYGNLEQMEKRGFHGVRIWHSSPDDWDMYETTQWQAAESWFHLWKQVAAGKESPPPCSNEVNAWDSSETELDYARVVFENQAQRRQAYLQHERNELGWAIYVGIKR